MTLVKLLCVGLLATLTIYGAATYVAVKIVDEVDNNGGVKAVVERIWNGKQTGETK